MPLLTDNMCSVLNFVGPGMDQLKYKYEGGNVFCAGVTQKVKTYFLGK